MLLLQIRRYRYAYLFVFVCVCVCVYPFMSVETLISSAHDTVSFVLFVLDGGM